MKIEAERERGDEIEGKERPSFNLTHVSCLSSFKHAHSSLLPEAAEWSWEMCGPVLYWKH